MLSRGGWYFAEALVEVAGEGAFDTAACFSAGFAGWVESLVVAGGLEVVVVPLHGVGRVSGSFDLMVWLSLMASRWTSSGRCMPMPSCGRIWLKSCR